MNTDGDIMTLENQGTIWGRNTLTSKDAQTFDRVRRYIHTFVACFIARIARIWLHIKLRVKS